MATVERAALIGERRMLLSGISWKLYKQLRANEENWHVRMAFDRGRLGCGSATSTRNSAAL